MTGHKEGVSHRPDDGARPHNLPPGLQGPFGWSSRRHRAPCRLRRQLRTMGRAVGGEFFYVGRGGDQVCVAGTEQLVRTMTRDTGDRPRHSTDLSSELVGFGCHPQRSRPCASVIEFSESHRSSPAVLNTVNALVPLTSGRTLTAADPSSWPSGGLAASVAHESAKLEADWIVNLARAILSRVPKHRIGVLARTAPRRKFADEAFAATDVVHYRWDDGVLDTDTAKFVKAMLARFDLVAYAAVDKMAFLRDAASFESITDVDIRKSMVDALGWVQDLLSNGVDPEVIRARIRVGDSSTLITSAGVHLFSGHVGKGQQFDWVIVVGLEEDCIPFFKATTAEEIAEEARVLAVMISRARHGVILSQASSVPTNNGHSKSRTPSRFLESIATASPLDASGIIEWFKDVDWPAISKR